LLGFTRSKAGRFAYIAFAYAETAKKRVETFRAVFSLTLNEFRIFLKHRFTSEIRARIVADAQAN